MKLVIPFLAFSCIALLSGCSSDVVAMGNDTYMVEHRGSSLSTEASNEAKCLQEANEFCASKGLTMVVVSSTGRNGLPVPFGHGGDCRLVFRAQPANLAPVMGDRSSESKDQTVGQQLIDLQKAKAAGAITDAEYEVQKEKILRGK